MNKLIYTASLTAFCFFIAYSQAKVKPNIVVYLADDQGQADGTVYGAKVLTHPNKLQTILFEEERMVFLCVKPIFSVIFKIGIVLAND